MILSTLQRNIDGTIGYMSDFWAITAASEQAEYPATNLQTPDLNRKWVSWGQRASHNWLEIVSDTKNSQRQIALAALLGLDRTTPSHPDTGSFSQNTYRVIVDSLYPIATRRRPPVESVVLTNLVGTAEQLNGPLDPPSLAPTGYAVTKMTATNPALNTDLIASFYNHNAIERPLLATTQTIRVHYAHSADISVAPTLTTTLRYAGVSVGSPMAATDIEQTSEGYIYTYSFNASTLPGLTGRIGVRVIGTSTGTSTPVPIGVEFIATLEWGTDGQSWDSLIDTTISSGVSYPQIAELPRKESVDEDVQGIVPYEILEGETVYVYFELSDWVEEIEFAKNPLGGHEGLAFYAGRLVVAEGIQIDLKENGGYNRRKVSDLSTLRSYGGTLRGTRNALHWDEHDFNARIQAQSTVIGELERFYENAGMRNSVAIVPDEAEPGQTIYGVLTRWELADVGAWVEPGNNTADAEPYYGLSFSAIDARARHTPR